MIKEKIIIYIIWPILYPFFNFVLPLFSNKVRRRIAFENLNLTDLAVRSFKEQGINADLAFEISSVGELEQAFPLIKHALQVNKKVELIYCSKSVEDRCQELYRANKDNLRLLRLPLLTYLPFSKKANVTGWISAKTFILCRYDFFPELMLYGARKDVRFILISATVKNKTNMLKVKRTYSLFDIIVCATDEDSESLKKLLCVGQCSKDIFTFDFRIVQIAKRMEQAQECLSKIESLKDFFKIHKKIGRANSIIFGSFWAKEAQVFKDERFLKAIWDREILVVIAPHELNRKNVELVKRRCEHHSSGRLKCYTISSTDDDQLAGYKKNPGPIILTHRGILCEMYSNFKYVFVGGGHGRSIHSVLEPYLAKSMVLCGPKVHRSTEFDYIMGKSPDHVRLVDPLNKFYANIGLLRDLDVDEGNRDELMNDGKKMLQHLFDIIEG